MPNRLIVSLGRVNWCRRKPAVDLGGVGHPSRADRHVVAVQVDDADRREQPAGAAQVDARARAGRISIRREASTVGANPGSGRRADAVGDLLPEDGEVRASEELEPGSLRSLDVDAGVQWS